MPRQPATGGRPSRSARPAPTAASTGSAPTATGQSGRPGPPAEPVQTDLFDAAEAPAPAAAARPPGQALVPVQVAAADRPLSQPQREFNRLTALIASRRQALADWQAMQDECHQRATRLLLPEQQKLRAVQRATVLWIDGFLAAPPRGERLTKKLRQKLVFMLLTLARAVLDAEPDAEVEAAHDRHAAQTRAEDTQAQVDLAAGMLGELTGDPGLFEGPAASMDELLQRASARLRQQADQPPAGEHGAADPDEPAWARAAAAGRARRAEARAAQARQEASQSVREVYRRLASQLHPDREPDAAERARKTALMARVNDAHGRGDLLTLLTLQLEVAQIGAGHLATLPDARLRQFCLVLREQLAALDDELQQFTAPLAADLGQRPERLRPRDMAEHLDRQIRWVREAITVAAEDHRLLRDPATRTDFLRQIEVEDPDEQLDPVEEMLMMQAFEQAMAELAVPQAPRRRARRRAG